MVENINTSLTFLASLGVSVDGVSAKDIKDGNLKSILGLFFSLSRYKQQQKSLQQQHKQQHQHLNQEQQHRLSEEHQPRGQGSTSVRWETTASATTAAAVTKGSRIYLGRWRTHPGKRINLTGTHVIIHTYVYCQVRNP
ncbi:unnamed protein product [Candidula unifasciata]|uniref:Calponin-homology (CH) domain-containing protein n=1 Tax=Candidula unifasciata TaxID=100452 RepID=A0A8S3ZWL6_9EUPU|nr:unnamed protein product [Candidula unifasciata]